MRQYRLAAVILVGAAIWFLPVPSGVQPSAWHLLAIFVATMVGIVLRPIPMGAMAFVAAAFAVLSSTLTISEATAGFGSTVVWLVVAAFSAISLLTVACVPRSVLVATYWGIAISGLTWPWIGIGIALTGDYVSRLAAFSHSFPGSRLGTSEAGGRVSSAGDLPDRPLARAPYRSDWHRTVL